MERAPKLIYLLRKSIQADSATVPVLKRDDFPLRFLFGGEEITVEVTRKGNIQVSKQRLTGTDGE